MRETILRKTALGAVAGLSLLFMISCAPKISKFDPPRGTIGDTVTIDGQNFGATPAQNTVKFRGVPVPPGDVLSASTTRITTKVPAGATTGLIAVTTSRGTGESHENFIVNNTASAQWTFMVYLDADNNLEYDGIDDFKEMASVGSSAALNIVVQMDRTPGYSSDYGNWTDTRRFFIHKNDTPSSTPIQNLGEQNMGDPNVLRDFVEWAISNYPAEHYALVIWNHGGGWRDMQLRLMEKVKVSRSRGAEDWASSRTVASDSTNADELYMKEVQTALEAAKTGIQERMNKQVKLDVIGFDACLMGMVEVAYALRNVANYVVGSEELEPGAGWPYNTILSDVMSNPSLTPKDLASTIVTRYTSSYSSDVTLSAVDVAALDNLAQNIDAFTIVATSEWDRFKLARANAMQYHVAGFPTTWGTDLWDFADRASAQVTSTTVKNAAGNLKTAIDSFVVKESHSPNMAGSHGVAIYFPKTKSDFDADPEHAGYVQANNFMPVDFVLYHQWDNWLEKYNSNVP